MITERQIGQLQLAFKLKGSVAAAAKVVGICRATAKHYIDTNFKKRWFRRATTKRVKDRRKKLVQLATKVRQKSHRRFPAFGSAIRIRNQLFQETKETLSVRHVQRELKAAGLRCYKRPKAPTRCSKDRVRRKLFVKLARHIDVKRIVFSDESWFSTNENTGKVQYARCRSEVLPREVKARNNTACVQVWGAIGLNYRSELVIFPQKSEDDDKAGWRLNGAKYIRRCLSKIVPDLVRGKRVFQQDGARCHVHHKVLQYLGRKKVEILPSWPANSPDLNMIEPLWKTLKDVVGLDCPMTLDELVESVQRAWRSIPQAVINRHVMHFRRACRDV